MLPIFASATIYGSTAPTFGFSSVPAIGKVGLLASSAETGRGPYFGMADVAGKFKAVAGLSGGHVLYSLRRVDWIPV